MKIENRRYLGAKTKLLPFIDEVIEKENIDGDTFLDLFAGTGVVANHFSKKFDILVNDILYCNYVSYIGWFGNLSDSKLEKLNQKLSDYNDISAVDLPENYFSYNFSGTYFDAANSLKIGYIRDDIENLFNNGEIDFIEQSYLITSLLYAMDSIANTVGHYDAYRKGKGNDKNIILKELDRDICRKVTFFNQDANELVREIAADVVYIDPPYNSRQYSGAYHLLENIARWQKPKVYGVAKKMNRDNLQSRYCTVKAPTAFADLIENIKAKHIIVSFNNMETKGSSRSQSKISNEELFHILSKKGHTKVYKKKYRYYSTGKSNIKDHEELLFVCHVGNNKKSNWEFYKPKRNGFIKSPLNYTGGKHSLLPQIIPHFPDEMEGFVDLFCGGANVGVNVFADKIVLNDKNQEVIKLIELLKLEDTEIILKKINNIIDKYSLSKTSEFGYEYYGCNSSSGVGRFNKLKYEQLREDYNNFTSNGNDRIYCFFVLLIYSFNNQIRFNKEGNFNMPVGKRDFNRRVQEKLASFSNLLKEKDIIFSAVDFRNCEIKDSYFIYADPPYILGTASYNEQGGWSSKDEIDLYNYLISQSEKGVKFALSNVIEHKGEKNIILDTWIKKNNLRTVIINKNYNNSNYQTKNKHFKTIEVLVTNY